jgi:hypothetical protein
MAVAIIVAVIGLIGSVGAAASASGAQILAGRKARNEGLGRALVSIKKEILLDRLRRR